MAQIEIGVVGCGKISRKHLDAYQKIDDIGVTVTDIQPDRASEIAAQYDVAWKKDTEAVLTDQDIDAIDVCVPVTVHKEVIESALEEGKDVFCEKPLAQTTEEAIEIRQVAEEMGKMVMTGYLYRFHPAFELVKKTLSNNIIGTPHYATFRVGGRGSHRAWKHKSNTGGGAANEMLVHMLDLIIWWFGPPAAVEELWTDTVLTERNIGDETVKSDAEDLVVLKLQTQTGIEILCQSDLISPSYMNSIELHGQEGSIITSILDQFPTSIYCAEPTGIYDRGHNYHDFNRVDLFKKELNYFKNSVITETGPELNTLEDSIEVRRIIDSVLDRT